MISLNKQLIKREQASTYKFLFPTGGLSKSLLSSIHWCKLKGALNDISNCDFLEDVFVVNNHDYMLFFTRLLNLHLS